MTNPYRFVPDGEHGIISFSGGRTSGYLLRQVIEAYNPHHKDLPDHVRAIFCNTGREMPETLDFVRDCGYFWDAPITWLEYRPKVPLIPLAGDPLLDLCPSIFDPNFADPRGYAVVDYATASREGEPFLALVCELVKRRDRTIGLRPLANPVSRICTVNLKTRLKKRFVKREWGWKTYHSAIGFRADEAHRVERGFKYPEPGEVLSYPLHDAGVMREGVLAFWAKQPFDLGLKVDKKGEAVEGNCDLCFMKSAKKVSALAARYPERAKWWAAVEQRQALTDRATTFRQDRPTYAEMLAAVERGEPMDFGIFDDLTSCGSHGCTD